MDLYTLRRPVEVVLKKGLAICVLLMVVESVGVVVDWAVVVNADMPYCSERWLVTQGELD